jgi:hypothetical protein
VETRDRRGRFVGGACGGSDGQGCCGLFARRRRKRQEYVFQWAATAAGIEREELERRCQAHAGLELQPTFRPRGPFDGGRRLRYAEAGFEEALVMFPNGAGDLAKDRWSGGEYAVVARKVEPRSVLSWRPWRATPLHRSPQ